MRKKLTALCLFAAWLICAKPLFGEDVYFTNRAEVLYSLISAHLVATGKLDAGVTVNPTGDIMFDFQRRIFKIEVQTKDKLTGWLTADTVSIRDSVPLPENITRNRWTHSYYLDILQSGYMKRFFEHEPFWRDHYEMNMVNNWPWYHIASLNIVRFYNVFLSIEELSYNRYRFIIGRVEEESGIYSFYATCVEKRVSFQEYRFGDYFSVGEGARFSLRPDGDYLDVFVNGARLFELFRLDDEIERQFGNFMGVRDDPVDLSRIIWPRRADGTMDFPPPGTDMSSFQTSHTTADRLRVRDDPATDSLIVTTLDADAEVQVLETGPVETIGGTTAPWVRVLTANGFTGWAFSGFLESTAAPAEPEIHEPPEPVAATPAEPPAPVPQNDAASTPMPLWLLLAIVGAAVVVIGSAVLFAIRRKRVKGAKTSTMRV